MPKRRTHPTTTAPVAAPPVATLAPETEPTERPGSYGMKLMWLPQRPGAFRVTEDSALTYSAVWACIRVISETLAWLPWNVYRRLSTGGRARVPENPVDWLLSVQANPETTAFNFREVMIRWAASWGNGVAEIERDAAGRPLWLWQITPDRVCVERDSRGRIVYDIYNPGGPNTALPAEDVYHLTGPGFDGLVGYSVIAYAARSLATAISAEQQAGSFFGNDSTPGGIITHPERLSEEARKNILASWQARHGGATNRRVVAILEEGMKWEQTSLPPEDSQLIESRQYGPIDVCRWFRIQPHKIAELSRATFSNIESQGIEHVTDTLMPWAARLETEANIKLFGRTNRGAVYTRHNFNALMRGDAAARSAFYHTLFGDGVFSINDILELEDRNPIGPDGDKRFVPLNMQLLEKAGEDPPAPEPPPPQPPADTPPPPDDSAPNAPNSTPHPPLSALLAAHTPLLAEALARCASRACQRCADALKRANGDKDKYTTWVEKYMPDHAGYLARQVGPPARALAQLAGTAVEPVLTEFLSAILAAWQNALLSVGETGDVLGFEDQTNCAIGLAGRIVAAERIPLPPPPLALPPPADRRPARLSHRRMAKLIARAAADIAKEVIASRPEVPVLPPLPDLPALLGPYFAEFRAEVRAVVSAASGQTEIAAAMMAFVTTRPEMPLPPPPAPPRAMRKRVVYDARGRIGELIEEEVPPC